MEVEPPKVRMRFTQSFYRGPVFAIMLVMEENETSRAEKEPAIRTMKSDVAEFLKKTKPSLVSLLTKQAQADEARLPGRGGYAGEESGGHRLMKLVFVLVGLVLAAGGVFAVYTYFQKAKLPPPPSKPASGGAPPALIFFEDVAEKTAAGERRELLAMLEAAGEDSQPVGTFRRLVIRTRNGSGENAVIGLGEFLRMAASGNPPRNFMETARGVPQFFIYRQSSGPHFGIMFETADPAKTLQTLRFWEPAMQNDLEAFFLGRPPPASFSGFQDLIYKNLDFRYLRLKPDNDVGLGYLYFPARRLIIISTSEESLYLVINRLLESR